MKQVATGRIIKGSHIIVLSDLLKLTVDKMTEHERLLRNARKNGLTPGSICSTALVITKFVLKNKHERMKEERKKYYTEIKSKKRA